MRMMRALPSGAKLQHFDGVAGVEMEDLVAADAVDGGVGIRREQVVDGGRGVAVAGVFVGQSTGGDGGRGAVRFAEITAFDRERHELQVFNDLLGGEFGLVCVGCMSVPRGQGPISVLYTPPAFSDKVRGFSSRTRHARRVGQRLCMMRA